jgi:hypothetical protein
MSVSEATTIVVSLLFIVHSLLVVLSHLRISDQHHPTFFLLVSLHDVSRKHRHPLLHPSTLVVFMRENIDELCGERSEGGKLR